MSLVQLIAGCFMLLCLILMMCPVLKLDFVFSSVLPLYHLCFCGLDPDELFPCCSGKVTQRFALSSFQIKPKPRTIVQPS
jgi:hypothetical protein